MRVDSNSKHLVRIRIIRIRIRVRTHRIALLTSYILIILRCNVHFVEWKEENGEIVVYNKIYKEVCTKLIRVSKQEEPDNLHEIIVEFVKKQKKHLVYVFISL
jgi:hypothetical protein